MNRKTEMKFVLALMSIVVTFSNPQLVVARSNEGLDGLEQESRYVLTKLILKASFQQTAGKNIYIDGTHLSEQGMPEVSNVEFRLLTDEERMAFDAEKRAYWRFSVFKKSEKYLEVCFEEGSGCKFQGGLYECRRNKNGWKARIR